jgi:hypothetical protein
LLTIFPISEASAKVTKVDFFASLDVSNGSNLTLALASEIGNIVSKIF